MKVFTGHLPNVGDGGFPADLDLGLDVLLTVHDDGTHELATRPGADQRWVTWSAPVTLTPEPAGSTSGGRP